ncbi:hypothetical protein D3Z52_14095 [Clostridiaceae bacterium]|nr:hypothetical protein [Clostridiaceae bacterium]
MQDGCQRGCGSCKGPVDVPVQDFVGFQQPPELTQPHGCAAGDDAPRQLELVRAGEGDGCCGEAPDCGFACGWLWDPQEQLVDQPAPKQREKEPGGAYGFGGKAAGQLEPCDPVAVKESQQDGADDLEAEPACEQVAGGHQCGEGHHCPEVWDADCTGVFFKEAF